MEDFITSHSLESFGKSKTGSKAYFQLSGNADHMALLPFEVMSYLQVICTEHGKCENLPRVDF